MSCTGVTIFDLNTYKPILITSVKTNSKDEYGDRLHTQREYIKELICKYPPFEVAIEKGFTAHNVSTQVIYRVHGVAQELLHDYPQFYYAPTTVKKLVSSSGRSSKEVLQASILKRYPDVKFANTDESDSFGVGITHLVKVHKMKW